MKCSFVFKFLLMVNALILISACRQARHIGGKAVFRCKGRVVDQYGDSVPGAKVLFKIRKRTDGQFGNVNGVSIANWREAKSDFYHFEAIADAEGYFKVDTSPVTAGAVYVSQPDYEATDGTYYSSNYQPIEDHNMSYASYARHQLTIFIYQQGKGWFHSLNPKHVAFPETLYPEGTVAMFRMSRNGWRQSVRSQSWTIGGVDNESTEAGFDLLAGKMILGSCTHCDLNLQLHPCAQGSIPDRSVLGVLVRTSLAVDAPGGGVLFGGGADRETRDSQEAPPRPYTGPVNLHAKGCGDIGRELADEERPLYFFRTRDGLYGRLEYSPKERDLGEGKQDWGTVNITLNPHGTRSLADIRGRLEPPLMMSSSEDDSGLELQRISYREIVAAHGSPYQSNKIAIDGQPGAALGCKEITVRSPAIRESLIIAQVGETGGFHADFYSSLSNPVFIECIGESGRSEISLKSLHLVTEAETAQNDNHSIAAPSVQSAPARCPLPLMDAGVREVRCCWPGQKFDKIEDVCTGLPSCPAGYAADQDHCVQADWVKIPAGKNMIGCVPLDKDCDPDEIPAHEAAFASEFWMLPREVTVAQYRLYASNAKEKLPTQPTWSGPDHPVVNVSFRNADKFCKWAGGRLPDSLEWEYAARGGVAGKIFPWGDTPDAARANFTGVTGKDVWLYSAPVGSFPPNGYALYDMAGNVWEWVRSGGEFPNPTLRGGGWGSPARHLRISFRINRTSDIEHPGVGFRCMKEKP